jgi:hypothetical protein
MREGLRWLLARLGLALVAPVARRRDLDRIERRAELAAGDLGRATRWGGA